MLKDNQIVITLYGKDNTISHISVSLFDTRSSADNYCDNINDFQLQAEEWVYAQIVSENEKIEPIFPECIDMQFLNACCDDLWIQDLVRRFDNRTWALALNGIDEGSRKRIFKNMTNRRAEALREEMESHRDRSSVSEARKARREIVKFVREHRYYGSFF